MFFSCLTMCYFLKFWQIALVITIHNNTCMRISRFSSSKLHFAHLLQCCQNFPTIPISSQISQVAMKSISTSRFKFWLFFNFSYIGIQTFSRVQSLSLQYLNLVPSAKIKKLFSPLLFTKEETSKLYSPSSIPNHKISPASPILSGQSEIPSRYHHASVALCRSWPSMSHQDCKMRSVAFW